MKIILIIVSTLICSISQAQYSPRHTYLVYDSCANTTKVVKDLEAQIQDLKKQEIDLLSKIRKLESEKKSIKESEIIGLLKTDEAFIKNYDAWTQTFCVVYNTGEQTKIIIKLDDKPVKVVEKYKSGEIVVLPETQNTEMTYFTIEIVDLKGRKIKIIN